MITENLIQGDCYELLKEVPDNFIDLIITDPPYKFTPQGGGIINKRNYTNKLNAINCCDFEPEFFLDAIKPKMKKFYGYFFCNKALVPNYINWAIKNKYNYDILVLAKSNPIPAYNAHHLSDLEYVILIRESGTYFGKDGKLDDYRKFYMTKTGGKSYHPAQKPEELIKRFITISSKKEDLIIDPFMGSGTTGVVAERLERKFIGIEMDEKYFNVAKQRISESKSEVSYGIN